MNRRNGNSNIEREKRIRVRRCRNDFGPTGQTLMQMGCCCCCCCLHWIGAAIGTAVGATGAFMRESHLQPEQRASDPARRTVGIGLIIGFAASVIAWIALYFIEHLLGGDGEMVAGTLVFAPGFAVLPMSVIVIIFGFFADQTNNQWVPPATHKADKLNAADSPFDVNTQEVDELGSSELDPSANSVLTNSVLTNSVLTNSVSTNSVSTNSVSTNSVSTNSVSTNWGGLRLAIRAAWMIFAVATLFSGLGYALMTVMMR